MLARRVIAISPDKAVAKRLGLGLRAAGGTVETYESPESLAKGTLQAGLVVVYVQDADDGVVARVADRLRDGAMIIVVLPKSNLVDTVALMQSSNRIAGLLVADDLRTEELAAMAYRVLQGDIFGIEKVVPWGTRVYSTLVGDYQEKAICISEISEFSSMMGVRRKYRESIEQVIDEMLMNALYDAPVDAEGNQMFADVPTKTRISLRMEQKAVVQYACDGDTFTVSVRDSFGTLDRNTVLRYLHKCLHSDQQIDRKTGGAGLGLYIMANTTTLFLFNVLPGVATEVICTFNLQAPKVQLEKFGFFTEKIDPAGRLVGGPSKLIPSGASYPVERRDAPMPAPATRAITLALGAAILLLLALIGLVAYPRFSASPTASIQISSEPAGASIEVDGAARGGTAAGPLLIDELEPGRSYRITAIKEGWKPESKLIAANEHSVTAIRFQLRPKAVNTYIDSDPPDAEVFYEGRKIGVTPFNYAGFPASRDVELAFRKTGYVPGKRKIHLPSAGGQLAISHAMVMDPNWGSARITSQPPGAIVFHNNTRQAKKTPIEDHLVAAGRRQHFTLELPGYQPAHVYVKVKPGQRNVPVKVVFERGGGLTVTAPRLPQALVTVKTPSGKRPCNRRPAPMKDCPLPDGHYRVELVSGRPYARIKQEVTIAGNDVTLPINVGIVSTSKGYRLLVRNFKTSKAAFLPGNRVLQLVDLATGTVKKVKVNVRADKTLTLP